MLRIALGALAAIVGVLVLSQVLLAGIAAGRVREKVERYGTVKSVTVKAFPAVKLLWGDADEVRVRAGSLSTSPSQTAGMVSEASGTARVDGSAESLREGPLRLTDVSFHKDGSRMVGEGTISEEDVRGALPAGVGVTLLASGEGAVEVSVSGQLFGLSASVDAVAKAENGELVAQPKATLLEGLKTTLFANPKVYVEGVGARKVTGDAGGRVSYRLTMWASLR
jgi:hypothetical protein